MPPAEFFFFPFDEGPGSESAENQWGEMFVWMRTTGVLSESTTLNASTDDLAVTSASGTELLIQVAIGEAWIQGFMYQHTTDYQEYAIEANTSGDPRIDLVVVELDVDNNIIEEKVVTGTPDPSPVAPTPIQNATIWQFPLAEIAVADSATYIDPSDITDVRVRSMQGDGGSSAVTLDSASAESLVADGVGPDLQTKGLVGVGIGITSDSTTVTLTSEGAPTDTPICVLRRNASLSVNNGVTPIISWTTAVFDPYTMWNGTTGIVIPEDGWYQILLNLTWTGDASANGSLLAYVTKVGTRLAENRIMIVGDEDVSNNISTIANLSASDVVTAVVTNNSGANLTIPTGGSYTPVFSLWKVRS